MIIEDFLWRTRKPQVDVKCRACCGVHFEEASYRCVMRVGEFLCRTLDKDLRQVCILVLSFLCCVLDLRGVCHASAALVVVLSQKSATQRGV